MYTDLNIDTDAISNMKDNKIYKSYTILDDALYLIDNIQNNDAIKSKLKININFVCDNLKDLYNDLDKELTLVHNIEFENTKILSNASLWLSKIKLSLNNVRLNKINVNNLSKGLNLSLNSLNNINNIGNIGNFSRINNFNNFTKFTSLNNLNNIGDISAISISNNNSFNAIKVQVNSIGTSSYVSALNSDISNFKLDSSLKSIGNFVSFSGLALATLNDLKNIDIDNINNLSSLNSNLDSSNLNLNGIDEIRNIISNNWSQSNINMISSIGDIYENGIINKEQFNSLILVNSLNNSNWNNLKLKNENGEISNSDFKLMEQIRDLTTNDLQNQSLLSSLFCEDNQKSYDNLQLQLGKELLGISSTDSKLVSSLLINGALDNFNINSGNLNLASLSLNSLSTQNPYNSVILSTLLGVYISAYAIILYQDAKEIKEEKKEKRKGKKRGGNI